MKKLGINTAAAIMDIIGASFYAIVWIATMIAPYLNVYAVYFHIVYVIVWCFSLAGSIVGFIAYDQSKKKKITLFGFILGLLGHAAFLLGNVGTAFLSMVLCILGAVFTFLHNTYLPATTKQAADNEEENQIASQ